MDCALKLQKLKDEAKKFGYSLDSSAGGRHSSKFVNEQTGHKVPVPQHGGGKEIKDGTAKAILKQMGYTPPKKDAVITVKSAEELATAKAVKKQVMAQRTWKKQMQQHRRGLGKHPGPAP
ncbi:MAG: type II toxin-antitoxin system HicA family toxin [Proteobacteria bacterium]|nr:type II toxin-antitoxin system HicA family toxin [Pseudomonadota bacterium]